MLCKQSCLNTRFHSGNSDEDIRTLSLSVNAYKGEQNGQDLYPQGTCVFLVSNVSFQNVFLSMIHFTFFHVNMKVRRNRCSSYICSSKYKDSLFPLSSFSSPFFLVSLLVFDMIFQFILQSRASWTTSRRQKEPR